MGTPTKILFSDSEAAAISEASFFLTKKNITEKIYQLFADECKAIKKILEEENIKLAEEIKLSVPKISRGENYKGLPYIICDYPAYFSKSDAFALRILFWWGQSFSVHLYLSGRYKLAYQKAIENNVKDTESLFICINDDPWKHEFEKNNYIPIPQLKQDLAQLPFIKLGLKIPISDLQIIDEKILVASKALLGLLK